MQDLKKRLFAMQDIKYRDFHAKLMPTIDKAKIIGIRTPMLRKFAAEFAKTYQVKTFLSNLPHSYYEENNLHGFITEKIKDYDEAIAETNRFLPFVDNWATCDMLRPKVFARNTDKLLNEVKQWLNSKHPYTVRYGIEMLMVHYLDENFSPNFPKLVSQIKSDEYYVNMMIAWYFATALAKQYDEILPYFTTPILDKWTHNKAIKKAVESYRITNEQKTFLKSLRQK